MFRVEPCLLEYISDTDHLCRINLRALRNNVTMVSDSEGYNYTFVVCGNLSSSPCGSSGVGESIVLHTSTYNCSPNRLLLLNDQEQNHRS
jgi:hypothetical protein